MMKALNNIFIFLILIILTCGVVFVPQIISGQEEEQRLSDTIHREYSTGNRPKLTSEQVAKLYYNKEITIGNNPLSFNQTNSETEIIRAEAQDIVSMLFGEDKAVCKYIQFVLENSDIKYHRDSFLIIFFYLSFYFFFVLVLF